MNGRNASRVGNRDDRFAPHGCYAISGDDAWIAIAVEDDSRWSGLCEVLDWMVLRDDVRFATREARVAHADELDTQLTESTRNQNGADLQSRLQARGVACRVVRNAAALTTRIGYRSW